MTKDTHSTNGNDIDERLDVLIVGAGISGISSAYYLRRDCPELRFAILDAHETYGGTWLIHRYPGARSDSDLFTFGYQFKPWTGAPIATREQILSYLGDVIDENNLAPHIRYGHRIVSASWSGNERCWLVEAVRNDTGTRVRIAANFLWMCQGYYDHAQGYTPQWAGMEEYRGQIVHPQDWPRDLDIRGKSVVVIGSGATAATLIPTLAKEAGHVTMLQRTPTYFGTGRNADALADELRRLEIDETIIHDILRRKVVRDRTDLLQKARAAPDDVKSLLLSGVRACLPPGFDVETHFTPPYRPLQQRVAFVPDGDLFKAVHDSKATIVTDEIDRFVADGVRLRSGKTLNADIVITATGFNLSIQGDIVFKVDGKEMSFADTVTYRGMMFTGVPNLAWIFGYSFHSWTLRAELIGHFVCRLLSHMRAIGASTVVPHLPPDGVALRPWVDPDEFNPGYLMRSAHLLPKFAESPDWQHSQDYLYEKEALPAIDLEQSPLVFSA